MHDLFETPTIIKLDSTFELELQIVQLGTPIPFEFVLKSDVDDLPPSYLPPLDLVIIPSK
jgi:hypothetical protein